MSGFLGNLAARTLRSEEVIRPRVASLFEAPRPSMGLPDGAGSLSRGDGESAPDEAFGEEEMTPPRSTLIRGPHPESVPPIAVPASLKERLEPWRLWRLRFRLEFINPRPQRLPAGRIRSPHRERSPPLPALYQHGRALCRSGLLNGGTTRHDRSAARHHLRLRPTCGVCGAALRWPPSPTLSRRSRNHETRSNRSRYLMRISGDHLSRLASQRNGRRRRARTARPRFR